METWGLAENSRRIDIFGLGLLARRVAQAASCEGLTQPRHPRSTWLREAPCLSSASSMPCQHFHAPVSHLVLAPARPEPDRVIGWAPLSAAPSRSAVGPAGDRPAQKLRARPQRPTGFAPQESGRPPSSEPIPLFPPHPPSLELTPQRKTLPPFTLTPHPVVLPIVSRASTCLCLLVAQAAALLRRVGGSRRPRRTCVCSPKRPRERSELAAKAFTKL